MAASHFWLAPTFHVLNEGGDYSVGSDCILHPLIHNRVGWMTST